MMRTNLDKTKSFTNWFEMGMATRLLLWVAISLALSLTFFWDFWVSLPDMLSPNRIFGEYEVSSWGVLALCFIFLWLKRKEVWKRIDSDKKLRAKNLRAVLALYIKNFDLLLGVALVTGAVLMPASKDFMVFQVLLAWLGVLIIIFGKKTAKIPAILLAIYGFAVSFPFAIYRFAAEAYTNTALVPLTGFIRLLVYPLETEGQWIRLVSLNGESIAVIVTAACAGPATMGVFIALFALMSLDMPLPPRKAVGLFLFGVVGTWFQSFVRLIILLLAGYYLGKDALWTAHSWSIYLVFPLWYLLFAYIYFRQVGRIPGGRLKQELSPVPLTE